MCVGYSLANATCVALSLPPNMYSCPPGLAPMKNGCVVANKPNGMDDYCCP
jgi:hypothetical protein